MNSRRPQMPDQQHRRLESLYRQHGDVEPGAGLDRTIRARAEAAVRRGAVRRPPRWIGAVASAAVVVVAVGIVIQQVPTGPDLVPETVESPALETDSQDGQAATRARVQRTPVPAAEQAQSDQTASVRLRREAEGVPAAELAPFHFDRGAVPAATVEPAASLLHIQALIDQGETEQARELLQALRQLHPQIEIPATIIDALAPEAID